jgi:D-3-phosphoglycerate dehydrogenase
VSGKPTLLVTGADLAPQALALLTDFDVVFAGKTPTEDDIVALCKRHDPVAIIVRYSKVGASAMDAAPSLKVISKHGSGTDTIDKVAAKARGIEVVAAVGANAAAVANRPSRCCSPAPSRSSRSTRRMRTGHWDKATHKSIELEGQGRRRDRTGRDRTSLRQDRRCHGHARARLRPLRQGSAAVHRVGRPATIWREADAISLHCPLTADNAKLDQCADPGGVQARRGHCQHRTRWLIDEARFAMPCDRARSPAPGLDSFAVEPMTVPASVP